MGRLSKDEILRAFDCLSEEMRQSGARCELLLAGGAAMVLVLRARDSTKDVDAIVIAGSGIQVQRAVERVAQRLNLPEHWLNDAFKGYLHGVSLGPIVYASDTVLVKSVSIEQLLAMKLAAYRDEVDFSDARLLMSNLRGTRDHVWNLIETFLVPGRELKARYAFEDLWDQLHGPS